MFQLQVTPTRARRSLAVLGVAAAIGLGACTGAAATPAPTAAPTAAASTAVDLAAEVDATVAGLESALTKYRAGDKQGALDAIAETYENHFELVEHPLEEVDHDFMENLEELIAVKTRAVIQDGKPVADLEALVSEAKTLLAQAKDMLK
ncbi:MAG: hypothetical protein FJ038_02405 [Chloroflexi bacterium]|nr:hypothetical protein [Chloroflexota bacterium]